MKLLRLLPPARKLALVDGELWSTKVLHSHRNGDGSRDYFFGDLAGCSSGHAVGDVWVLQPADPPKIPQELTEEAAGAVWYVVSIPEVVFDGRGGATIEESQNTVGLLK